jgi:hypothetical protein
MVITLTPEIEQALNEYAEKQGTTIELLALSAIREKFLYQETVKEHTNTRKVETLADRLSPYIGIISSSEIISGGANMSVDSSKKFVAGLLQKQKQGRL